LPTASIPFNSQKITGLGAATLADDAVKASQVQSGALVNLGSVSGVDTITATALPTLAAYGTRQHFIFTPAGTNTTAATINIDGLGAKSIVKGSAVALVAGDLLAAVPALCIYNGTNVVLLNPQSIPLTAAGLLAALLTVDGSGSTLDADLFKGSATIAIGNGGTGATTAATARTALGVTATGADSAYALASTAALQSTTISVSGTGLSGGGSLAANRTITIDQTAMKCRNITGAAGVAVTVASDPGGTPSGNPGDVFEYY
jgi:hypothetical protein